MAQTINVTLDLKGLADLQKLNGPFERLERARKAAQVADLMGSDIQKLDARFRLAQALRTSQRASLLMNPQSVGIPNPAAAPPAGASSPAAPRAAQLPGGAFQRLQAARAAYQNALSGGSPDQIGDALAAVRRAQAAARRQNQLLSPQPTPFGQRLNQFVASTRFGAGGVQPLIGRGLALLGAPAAAAGPIGIAVAGLMAAGAAAKLFAEQVGEAAETARALRQAATLSGGTTGQIAGLTSMGLGSGDIAGLAAGLREKLASDPWAMMAGGKVGLGAQLPRQFGGRTNEAALLQTALEGLRKIKDAEEQLRVARQLGLEATLDLVRVSDDVWRSMQRDARVREEIFRGAEQSSRDFDGQMGRVKNSFENLRQSFVQPFFEPFGKAGSGFADELNGIALLFKDAQHELAGFGGALTSLAGFVMPDWLEALLMVGRYRNSGNAQADALNKNTQALKDATAAMAPGVYGGGARARGSIPAAMNGEILRETIQGQGFRFGNWA